MPSKQSKRFTIVLNNYTDQDIEHIITSWPTIVQFYILGREVAPTTNTPHLQGYVEFGSRKTLSSAKTLLGFSRLHLDFSKGTAQDNVKYCSKEDPSPLTHGTPMKQGSRSDLTAVREAILDGASYRDLAENHFNLWVRYRAAFKEYISMQAPVQLIKFGPYKWPIPDDIRSLVLWGNSDIGKSEFAKFLLRPNPLFISHLDQLQQYDATVYSGIVFDDMSFNHLPRESQIHLADWDNLRAIHIRYGVAILPAHTRKVFTTNNVMGAIFNDDSAISRRLVIKHLD